MIGTKTSIQKLSANDLKAFYQKFTPDKLTIYGGGKNEGRRLQKTYGKAPWQISVMKDFQSKPQPIGQPIEKPKFYAFNKDNAQTQVVMSFNIFNFKDERRPAFKLYSFCFEWLGWKAE